jgi:hypothetical protein
MEEEEGGVQIPVHCPMLGIPLLYLYRYDEANLTKWYEKVKL